jgi:predicted ATP-grasp superfamily ATP-dependent carboligase
VLDKAAFAAECAASGIPAPATAVLRDEAGWERAATLRAPYVAKAVRTHSWHPHLGPSVRRVETAAALRSLAERAWGLRTPLLVQEEVPGAPESVFFVGGLYDESHRPLHTFTGQKLLQYPQGTGTSCHAQLVDAPEVAAAADRIAATFGLSGLVDIEFMRDARDGLLKAIEVNPRAGLWHRISSDGACDLTLAYYAHLAGRPALTSGYRANEPGRRWVYPANHLCSTTDAFGLVRGIWHWANDVRRADVRCDWHPRDRARWRRLAAKLLRHRRRGAPE